MMISGGYFVPSAAHVSWTVKLLFSCPVQATRTSDAQTVSRVLSRLPSIQIGVWSVFKILESG